MDRDDIPILRCFDMLLYCRAILLLLSAAFILNGCILERIFRVKNQFCDFEKYFQIDTTEGFRVLLRNPVMLDEDITWLAGAGPSEQKVVDDELVMTYIAERAGTPSGGQYDLPVELRFVRLDGSYRLKEGYLSKNLADILTDELLSRIMQSVCESKKSLVKQQIVVDIRKLNRNLLPTKSDIIAILGPPNPNVAMAHQLVYDYQLKNNVAVDIETLVAIQFDRTDDRIVRIKVKYLQYNLDVDFERGEAVLRVDIFIEKQT